MKYKLIATLTLLFLNSTAQQIPDPSDASAEAILKSSPELNKKLQENKFNANEVEIKFAGDLHKYSTQCENVKNLISYDYYIKEFAVLIKKSDKHGEYKLRATVEYRRSNNPNDCKLDDKWKHVVTWVYNPVSTSKPTSIANSNELLINYFKNDKNNLKIKLNYGYKDVVSIKNIKTVNEVKCPTGYDKIVTDENSTTKVNLVTADLLEMRLNDDKSKIDKLRWNPHLFYVKTVTENGAVKIVNVSNEEINTCTNYKSKIIIETEKNSSADTIFSSGVEVGFDGIYNKTTVLPKKTGISSDLYRDELAKVLLDVLSLGDKLKNPESIKSYLSSKSDNGYKEFIETFEKRIADGYNWNNCKLQSPFNITYNCYGTKLSNRKQKAVLDIFIEIAEKENGVPKFNISLR